MKKIFEGRRALVTGAGSGIGRALSQGLAAQGACVVMTDINAAGLEETRALLTGDGHITKVLNVTDRDAIYALAAELERDGGLDMLFNNAGVALGGQFADVSEAEFDWLMDINFGGVVNMTRAMLPLLKKGTRPWIVNVSSIFGVVAFPGQVAYCASKFAVRGLSMALQQELEPQGIGVTCVHPGGIATPIARNARLPQSIQAQDPEQLKRNIASVEKSLVMPPEKAAEIILRAVSRGKARVLVGNDAKIMALIERFRPVNAAKTVTRLFFS